MCYRCLVHQALHTKPPNHKKRVMEHSLSYQQYPDDVTTAVCSCGRWEQSQQHPDQSDWAPVQGHDMHILLMGLAAVAAADRMLAAVLAGAVVDERIRAMQALALERD